MTVLSVIAQMLTYFSWTGAQIVAGGAICKALFGVDPTDWYGDHHHGRCCLYLHGRYAGRYPVRFLPDVLYSRWYHVGLWCSVLNAVGGFPGMFEGAGPPFTHPIHSPCYRLPEKATWDTPVPTGWMYWMAAWMAIGLGSVATQDLMQRSMAARNQATSVYGSYGAGVLYLFFGIMSPLIGIMMFKLNPNGLEDTSFLLVKASMDYLQPVLPPLHRCLVSALMSTSDSSLLAGASAVTENLIPLITRRKA